MVLIKIIIIIIIITLLPLSGIGIKTSIELKKKKKKVYIMQTGHGIPSKTKKFIFKPVAFFGSQSFFAVFKSIQVEFLSHTFKYS